MSEGWVEIFWSPSRLTAEVEVSRAHHTELGVWLQLISMAMGQTGRSVQRRGVACTCFIHTMDIPRAYSL